MSAPEPGTVLIHTCCAPCLVMPLDVLSREGLRLTAWFHNPNIHPLIEFRRRLKALKVLGESTRVPMVLDEEYGLRDYLETVDWRSPERCRQCCRMRLARAAKAARERGFGAFTTSMLSSRHMDHDAVREAGETAARTEGLPFLYRDFRPLAEEGLRRAKRLGLYLQSYCGCVFSEFERYRDTRLHLYRGASGREE